jgi:hypothetical protein
VEQALAYKHTNLLRLAKSSEEEKEQNAIDIHMLRASLDEHTPKESCGLLN